MIDQVILSFFLSYILVIELKTKAKVITGFLI